MITSAAASSASATGELAAGIALSGALVAVLLFVTLLARESALSAGDPRRSRAVTAVLLPLAAAFLLNLAVRAAAVVG